MDLLGGWGGSHYFSSATSSSANRTTFTNALKSAVSTYGLDGEYQIILYIVVEADDTSGIDIDWVRNNARV